MRTPLPVVFLVLALAAPAAAQTTRDIELDALKAQQQDAQRRAVDQANAQTAADAKARADQAILDLELERALPLTPPTTPYPAAGTGASDAALSIKDYPSTPDSELAASNSRVQAVVHKKRWPSLSLNARKAKPAKTAKTPKS